MRVGESLKGVGAHRRCSRRCEQRQPPRPEALRRLARPGTGQPVLDREVTALLAAQDDALLNESVVPMFVAPPDVCKAAGATLFYGLVPTTSSEKAEGGAPQFDEVAFGPTSADFKAHLVGRCAAWPTASRARAARSLRIWRASPATPAIRIATR